MAFDFSTIDTQVNEKISTAPVTPAAAPAPSPATPKPEQVPNYQEQLQLARAEIGRMKAEHEEESRARKLETLAAETKKPSTTLGNTVTDLALDKAIRACGGLAFFNQLSPEKQAEALGYKNTEQIKTAEVEKYFGPKSSSLNASRLARQDPERYKQLRAIAKTRGIL